LLSVKSVISRIEFIYKAKDEELETLRAEMVLLKGDLVQARQFLSDKDGAFPEREKDLDSANKAASTARVNKNSFYLETY